MRSRVARAVARPGPLRPARRVVSTEFDVLGPDGRRLGTVQVPEEIRTIYEIGGDYVLARWVDELDLSYLRMYRLVT